MGVFVTDDHSKQNNPASEVDPNLTAQIPVPPPNPLRVIPGGRSGTGTRPTLDAIRGGKPLSPNTSTLVPDAILNGLGIAILETLFPPLEQDLYTILNPPIGDPIAPQPEIEPKPEINMPDRPVEYPAYPITIEPDPVPNYPRHPADQATRDLVDAVLPLGNTSGSSSPRPGTAGNGHRPSTSSNNPYPLGTSITDGQWWQDMDRQDARAVTDARRQQAEIEGQLEREQQAERNRNAENNRRLDRERQAEIERNAERERRGYNWMKSDPSPAENPNSLPDVPPLLPIPDHHLDLTRRIPFNAPNVWPTRASQEEPANNDTPEPAPAETPPDSDAPQTVEDLYDGRRVDQLTAADKKRIREAGYTLVSEGDHKQIRKTRTESGPSNLHLEQVDGVWLIRKGPAPANSRDPSNSTTMWKNFLAEYNIKDKEVLAGFSLHHSIAVNVWKASRLTQLAQEYGLTVDDADGLIAMPRDTVDLYSVNDDIIRLENGGQLSRLLHPGSHSEWDKRVEREIDKEERRLKVKYGSLENVPPEELKDSVRSIRTKLREELKYASEQIKAGKYDQLPKYIRDYLPLDPKRPGYVKISDRSKDNGDSLLATSQDVAKLRANVRNFIAMANTFRIDNLSSSLFTNDLSTNQEFAQMLAVSTSLAMKGKDEVRFGSFSALREDDKINIYEPDGVTRVASVNTGAKTVTMYKAFILEQKASLESARTELLADAKSQVAQDASVNKAVNRDQLSLG
jgi:hypothetical protein